MKLLIVTQTIDTQDPILGFFVRWVEEFAKNCEGVHVLALNVGSYTLPDNVFVHSLGKSEGQPKIVWLWRLLALSFTLRHHYDATFVHMNPIHMAYAGLLWRLLGKRNGLWYTHPSVDTKLRLATLFTHVVYTGSASSFNIKTKKKNVMGQGVDPAFLTFKSRLNVEKPNLIVVGRISPIKHVENAIDTLALIVPEIDATLTVVGGPMSSDDEIYLDSLKERALEKGITDRIIWKGALPANEMQKVLAEGDIFIHTSLTHSADKTLPEAMSTGLFVVSSNRAYEADLPTICFHAPEPSLYAEAIKEFLSMNHDDQEELRAGLRKCVEEKHSLASLVKRILALY